MPNKFVFPGGHRLDLVDQRLKAPGELNPHVLQRLKEVQQRAERSRTKSYARWHWPRSERRHEETGLVVGRATKREAITRHAIWQDYFEHGVEPPLDNMDFFAKSHHPGLSHTPFHDTRFSWSMKSSFTITPIRSLMPAANSTTSTGSPLQSAPARSSGRHPLGHRPRRATH